MVEQIVAEDQKGIRELAHRGSNARLGNRPTFRKSKGAVARAKSVHEAIGQRVEANDHASSHTALPRGSLRSIQLDELALAHHRQP